MTTTVRQLIEFLQTQDQDAIVEVLELVRGSGYESDYTTHVNFDPSIHSEYTDFRGNKFVNPTSSWYNQRVLFLGSDD